VLLNTNIENFPDLKAVQVKIKNKIITQKEH